MEPTLDFSGDLKGHFIRSLVSAGYSADPDEELQALGTQFFNVVSRNISARTRVVHESSSFTCPPEYEANYSALKRKIQAGEDVTPNLSTKLLDANYQDLLLCDWAIHHFHLGRALDLRGFVARTGPLLFAHVGDADFYSIQILDHSSFTKQDLVRILHTNWPELLEPYRLKGVIGLEQNYSDEELAMLRRAGVQTMVEVAPEVVYAPMGGGYSTAGTSIRAQMQSSYWIDAVRRLEGWVIDHYSEFRNKLRDMGLIVPDPLNSKLLVEENGLYALETQSQIAFLLRPFDENG